MTTHTIELPDPKFQKNDVVRWGRLILHVRRVSAVGSWRFLNGEHDLEWDGAFRYDVTVQTGKGVANNPIRPGTVLTFSEVHVDDGVSPVSFGDAEKIVWDESIIGPDNIDNIGERQDVWDVVSLAEKHGDDVAYKYRNMGCDIAPDEELWCVTGSDTGPGRGTGVLEWCYDEKDAKEILAVMQLDPRFEGLSAVAFNEFRSSNKVI